jgi:DnaJ-class molecular chaperone
METTEPVAPHGFPHTSPLQDDEFVTEKPRKVCETCLGAGRVVDERQAGEPVATCMKCKGNGWVYIEKNQVSATSR